MTPTLAPPNLPGVTVIHQAGSGRAVTHGGTYPLRGLNFVHAANGRGIVSLQAGSGRFDLSGAEANQLAPGRWRLHIDRMALISAQPSHGHCDMVTRGSPSTYVSLRCRVLIGSDPRPVTVNWKGDGTPALRVR